MYIPTKLITQKYYVAQKITKALYSSKKLEDAVECVKRYKEHSPYEFNTIKGIVCVTPKGREWVTSDEITQLLSPISN